MKKLILILAIFASSYVSFGQIKMNQTLLPQISKIYTALKTGNVNEMRDKIINGCLLESSVASDDEVLIDFTSAGKKYAIGLDRKTGYLFLEEHVSTDGNMFDVSLKIFYDLTYRYFLNPENGEVVKVVVNLGFIDNTHYIYFEKELPLKEKGFDRGRSYLTTDECEERIENILKSLWKKCDA